MSDAYRLTPRKAWICRIGGGMFVAAALCVAVVIVASAATPEFLGLCTGPHCEVTGGPLEILPMEAQAQVRESPGATRAFESYQRRPLVRAGTMGVTMVEMAPFAVLLLGVGLALRRLGARGGDTLGRALPWLRRASIAAVGCAFAEPLSKSLHGMLLYPGTPAGPHWYFVLNPLGIGTDLMLAIAAYATVWALEAGLRAQRDLDDFV